MALLQSITFKVLGIGALALLMLLPLAQVDGLIRERAGLREEARRRIGEAWGGDQVVGGPVLAVPRTLRERQPASWVAGPNGSSVKVEPGWADVQRSEFRLADTLAAQARLQVERRRYGIYEFPVYTARVTLRARFAAADLAPLRDAAAGYDVSRAQWRLPVADLRGLREVAAVRVNGEARRLEPSDAVAGIAAVAIPLQTRDLDDALLIEAEFELAGTERLQFLPLARSTTVDVAAPWGDPSFIGAGLPVQRRVASQDFTAHWQALDLNRGFPQTVLDSDLDAGRLGAAAFGVALYQPVDVYRSNERAGKYGLLFIALSFVAFFLFEVLKRLRVHPLQYLLVGLALATFYLVLLALSEQLGFGLAYALAAAAVVLMVGGYAAAVLATRRAGVLLGATMAAVYGLLYALVVSEQYSLLVGALVLLGVVGLLMYLTRRVDWYADLGTAVRRPASAG